MKSMLAIGVLAFSLGACAGPMDNRTANGALLGGAGGALIGGLASDSVGGRCRRSGRGDGRRRHRRRDTSAPSLLLQRPPGAKRLPLLVTKRPRSARKPLSIRR